METIYHMVYSGYELWCTTLNRDGILKPPMDYTIKPKALPDEEGQGMSSPDAMPLGVAQMPIELGNALVDGVRVPDIKDTERLKDNEPPEQGLNL
jgi:hypothetical protein